MKKVGTSAFEGCSGLTELTIPDSVEYLSQKAFANCANLRKVNFNAANCTYAGANNGRSAFAGCTALSEVVFGSGVKSIPEQVFRECKALHSVTIPGNVETLNKSNFYSSGLKSVVLSEGVKTINESVFGSCDSMVAITIPASVDFIDAKAFNGVPKTAKISCPVGSYAEQWARENGYLTTHDYAIDNGSLTFAEGVSKIPNSYFAGNADITSVEIPYEIDMINQAAFKNCANLQTVYYNAVRSTNNSNGSNSAFYNCPNLTKVVVGEGVETIPPQLFEQCTALKTIEIPASVTQINNKPFPTTATIICPADSYAERWARQKGYNVVLLDSEISHTESVLSLQIYAKDGFIGGSGDIRIFNLLGQDVTHLNGSLRGVYIVKIGYAVEKVIVE